MPSCAAHPVSACNDTLCVRQDRISQSTKLHHGPVPVRPRQDPTGLLRSRGRLGTEYRWQRYGEFSLTRTFGRPFIRIRHYFIIYFISAVAPSNSVSRLPNSSVLINFNLTATNEESNGNDAVMAAKLRVYKNQLTDEKILALRASGCNTSAITLQLFAVGGKTTAESLANVTLTRDDLRTGKWLTFGNLAGTYRQWIKNATSNVQSLAVVAVGTCSASALGFDVDSAALNPPLLVAFIRSSDQNMDFITKGLGEATVSRVQTRDVASNNNPCQLHTYQVRIHEMQYIPPKKERKKRASKCETTTHMQI